MTPRTLLVVVLLVGCGACSTPADQRPAPQPTVPRVQAVASSEEPPAVGVLHRWERRRSAAWAQADAVALRRLYVRGSSVGRRDVALLRQYAARGLVVTRMRSQLLAVAVVVDRPHRLVLRVTERLDAEATGTTGVRLRLPRAQARERVVELRRVAGEWRMASVRRR